MQWRRWSAQVDNVAWLYGECECTCGYAGQRMNEHAIACAGIQMGGECGLLHSHLGCTAVAAQQCAERDSGGRYCRGQQPSCARVLGPANARAVIWAYNSRGSPSLGLSRL